MNTHVGLVKCVNGIDYIYNQIPENITLFPSFIHKEETIDIHSILNSENVSDINKLMKCISNEIIYSLLNDLNIHLSFKSFSINKITNNKGIPPITHSNFYNSILVMLNIGDPTQIVFKNNKNNNKFIFKIDNGMMILIKDDDYTLTRNIPFSNEYDNDRYILTFYFNK